MVQWCNGILFQWYNDQWKEEGTKRSVSKIFLGVFPCCTSSHTARASSPASSAAKIAITL